MKKITRRTLLKKIGRGVLLAPFMPVLFREKLSRITEAHAAIVSHVYVSRNGTPVANMQKVVEMAGGIANYIDSDDVVVIKPNLQWKNQGYTHTEATKALIDIILNRPGGFTGEIIVAENTHGQEESTSRGWAVSAENRVNNWSAMNYNELIAWYPSNGVQNVTAAKLMSSTYPDISGPSEGQGYVQSNYTISYSPGANGRVLRLSYPIIQSSYSGKLIDTKNGVWSGGGYTGQRVKLIFLPTLNNHGSGNEDYAGATSAVKCHLGFVKTTYGASGRWGLHQVGYGIAVPSAVGEGVGQLITNIIQPTLYITVAEYSGWHSRTSATGAENTKTIGLCSDPVALDYWMGKNVLGPCNGGSAASYLDPSNICTFRKTLEGCQVKGVGTLDEAQMSAQVYDFLGTDSLPPSAPSNLQVI